MTPDTVIHSTDFIACICAGYTHTNGFLLLLALQVPLNLVWLFYNAASQKLFPARTLFEDFVCDVLSMIVLSHMNTQLILADYCKVLRLQKPENSPYISFFLCSVITTCHKWALREAMWSQFWYLASFFFLAGPGYHCYNLWLCACAPSHTREGILSPASFIGPINLQNAKLVNVHLTIGKLECWKLLVWYDAYWWENWAAFHPDICCKW